MRHSIPQGFFSLVSLSLLATIATAFSSNLSAAEPAKPAAKNQTIAIAEVKRNEPVDFQKEILPILKKSCLACHNATQKESDLILESPQSILKGGASGPAVDLKNPKESLLLGRATGEVDGIMPPKGNKVAAPFLKPQELGLIKLWNRHSSWCCRDPRLATAACWRESNLRGRADGRRSVCCLWPCQPGLYLSCSLGPVCLPAD
jgi:hypothetical protein